MDSVQTVLLQQVAGGRQTIHVSCTRPHCECCQLCTAKACHPTTNSCPSRRQSYSWCRLDGTAARASSDMEGQGSSSAAPAPTFPPSQRSELPASAFASNEAPSAALSSPARPSSSFVPRGGGAQRGSWAGFGAAATSRGFPPTRGKSFANRSVVFHAEATSSPSPVSGANGPNGEEAESGPQFQSTELNAVEETGILDSEPSSSHALSRTNLSTEPVFSAVAPSATSAGRIDGLGGPKDGDEVRKKRFEALPAQNRFFQMKQQRDGARLEYIRQGVLPDPDKAQDLSAAKSLLGTCMEMCPEFEREEREFQNEGDALEMVRKRASCEAGECSTKLCSVPGHQSNRSNAGSQDLPPACSRKRAAFARRCSAAQCPAGEHKWPCWVPLPV